MPDRGSRVTRFAQRGSARLAYEATGEPGARLVVALHDLLADRASLAPLRDALLAAGFRVVAPDLRGHGASAAIAATTLSMADLTTDLLAVLDAETAGAADVVGHGLGGALALALAEIVPARVRSLALLEPAVAGILAADPDLLSRDAAARVRDAAREASDLAGRGQSDRALDRWLEPRRGRGWRDRLSRAQLGAVRRHAAALGPILAAESTHAPRPEGLADLSAPTLLLRLADAPALDRAVAERLAAIPGARSVVLAPSVAPLADPALAEAIVAFVRSVPA